MPKRPITFEFVEKQLRKKTFGILGTVSPKGWSHSTGILYRVSPLGSPFSFYLAVDKSYKKYRNIKNNPQVSFVVPFPHFYFRFVPANSVQFQGTAEILPIDDPEGQKAFKQKRILKMALEQPDKLNMDVELAFIRIKPLRKLFCYGLGFNIMELRKHIESGSYTVTIPPERL